MNPRDDMQRYCRCLSGPHAERMRASLCLLRTSYMLAALNLWPAIDTLDSG
jgi:hypothetical protein